MLGVDELYIGGLATDYCVKETALEALNIGFKATVLNDAVKGVNLKRGDSERAVGQILLRGGKINTLKGLTKALKK